MPKRKVHTIKTALRRLTPKSIVKRRSTRQLFRELADKLGLVYFGFVDQTDDEHRLIRGITVSNTHKDHHYTVGTFKGYDVSLTIRRDAIEYKRAKYRDHYWTIVTADFHTRFDLPHLFIGNKKAEADHHTKLGHLTKLSFGSYAPHPVSFLQKYDVYGRMTHAQIIEMLLTPQLTEGIVQHFDGASLEIQDNTLYVYASERHPTRPALEKMLNNALWMVESIDHRLSKN